MIFFAVGSYSANWSLNQYKSLGSFLAALGRKHSRKCSSCSPDLHHEAGSRRKQGRLAIQQSRRPWRDFGGIWQVQVGLRQERLWVPAGGTALRCRMQETAACLSKMSTFSARGRRWTFVEVPIESRDVERRKAIAISLGHGLRPATLGTWLSVPFVVAS